MLRQLYDLDFYTTLKRTGRFLEWERSHFQTYEMPLKRRLWLYRHGFLSRADTLYDFDTYEPSDYLTDVARNFRTPDVNAGVSPITENKLITHLSFEEFDEHFPTLYGVFDEKRFYSTVDDLPTSATDALEALLNEHDRIVVKALRGSGGDTVRICERDGDFVRIDGNRWGYDAAASILNELGPSYGSAYVDQHEYADQLYPETVNTMRILTMIDPDTQKPFIAIATHRIGTKQTGDVDNFGKGGVAAEVDLETGKLSKAAQQIDSELRWTDAHPDTGAQIEGVAVPGWEQVKKTVIKLAASKPYLPYAGWDVVVTSDESVKIIEVNGNSGMAVLQTHRPLLANERVERFYTEHGVI